MTEKAIVARFELLPERREIRARIDEHGAIRAVSPALGQCRREGLPVHPLRRRDPRRAPLQQFVLPSSASVGWWFKTRYAPFFEAHIHDISQY